MFSFNLEDKVYINLSGVEGMVKGRAEYTEHRTLYWVRYVTNMAEIKEIWLTDLEIHK
jgi:hypothetical protein